MTPRLLFWKVRTEFWCKVSVALVLQDLIGAVRHLARNVGDWCEHAADHGACTLRHAAHHTTNQADAWNVRLLIERNGWSRKWLQETQCANQPRAQIRSRHNRINESCLQQEFGALETGGEFVANRSRRDARAAESNQRIRLGNVQVTERTERCNRAARRWVGEEADKSATSGLEARNGGERLRQLHQRVGPLLHPCAAGGGDDQEWESALGGELCGACHLLPHHGAHGAAHEEEVHDHQGDLNAANGGGAADGGVALAR